MGNVGILGRGVIPPDDHPAYVGYVPAALQGELAQGTVVVQTGHRGESLGLEVRGVRLGDQTIRVGRIADHQDPNIPRGVVVDGFSLRAEDFAVLAQQIGALHARGARFGADQDGVVGLAEALGVVHRGHDAVEERKGAIGKLHHHPFEDIQRRGDLDQLENNRLI